MGEFSEALMACAYARPIEDNAFIRRLCRGEYAREDLRLYAEMMASVAEAFPRALAAVLSICPRHELRVHLLKNLCEEEAIVPSHDGRGLVCDPARRHPELARHFTRALGISDDRRDVAHPHNMTRWFDHAVRERQWIATQAFLTAIEANIPRTYKVTVPALRDLYGFTDDDIAFFIEHIDADQTHASVALDIIERAIDSPAERKAALEGARRGATAWWQMHSACDAQLTTMALS